MVGLDWVELDEGLMAWQRVIQIMMRTITWVTKLYEDPPKREFWSNISLTGDPGYLDKSSSETLKVSLHQMIPSKYILKCGLSHFYFDNSPTDSFVKCKAVADVVG